MNSFEPIIQIFKCLFSLLFFFENSLEEWLRLGGQQLQYSYRSPLLKKIKYSFKWPRPSSSIKQRTTNSRNCLIFLTIQILRSVPYTCTRVCELVVCNFIVPHLATVHYKLSRRTVYSILHITMTK